MAILQTTHLLGLQCVRCNTQHEWKTTLYTCPQCGGNLKLEFDLQAIGKQWRRQTLRECRDFSIWRYAPLYPVAPVRQGPPVGWTPLIEAPRLAQQIGLQQLYLKDDGRNPSASFKDRASIMALAHARASGASLVIGASTGNAASSTAVLAASMGIRTRIFIPQRAPRAKVSQLLAFGAEVLAVQGTYDDAFDLSLAATRRFGWYNRNTGFNPYTREGKKSVAFEVCEQLQWQVPDLVVVPVGDGNIISGVWKGFDEFYRLGFIPCRPRLLAVQAQGSNAVLRALETGGPLAAVTGQTVADSIAVSLPRDGEAAVQAIRDSGGFGVAVSDEQILASITELARDGGVFAEPAAAASWAGLKVAAADGRIDPRWSVVLLITGNGLKDVEAVMRVVGQPRPIAADVNALTELFEETND